MKPIVSALLALPLLAPSMHAQIRPDAVMLRYPDVSAEHIVFRYAGDLWLVEKGGGVARRITSAQGNEGFPRFSPDGKTLAFVAGYDGGSDLYTMPIDGGPPLRVTHHPSGETLNDWTPDGESLLFWSNGLSGLGRAPKIFRVAASGGQPEALPIPYGTFGSIDSSGAWLAYTPLTREFRTWKRYRGGMAQDIWLFNLNTNESRQITEYDGTDAQPMWHGTEVWFLSDRSENGVMNLWSYDIQSEEVRQRTAFEEFDVKFPAVGPEDIVFECGGKLYRFDFAADRALAVDVVLPGDRPALRPRAHDVSDMTRVVVPGPSAKRVLAEARGDIFSVPVEKGVTRNLTRTDGIAERDPAWSPDGGWIAYFSDRSGEYELTLRRSDGETFEGADESGEMRVSDVGTGWKSGPMWSPDSEHLVFHTNDGGLHLFTLESKTIARIATDPLGFGLQGVDWSADSAWLTWSHRHSQTRQGAIHLYEVATGEVHEVTSGMFDDSNPAFDLNGDWLYYSSSREFSPIYSDLDTTWIYTNATSIVAVPLRADVEDPWAPENEEEEIEEEGEEEEDEDGEAEEGDEDSDDDSEGESDGDSDGEEGDKEDEDDAPMTIDLEGFEARSILLPAEAGNLGGVDAAEGRVLFVRRPRTGSGEERSKLVFYDMEEKEEKTIYTGVNDYDLTPDGKKLLIVDGEKMGIVDCAPEQEIEKPIAFSALKVTVDPRREWRQVLSDAWRIMRDYFYDPGLHGVDWKGMRERYLSALADANSRGDLHFLIGEMIAELNVGHAYNGAPPEGLEQAPPALPVGLLGCEWSLEQGAYRIASILHGGSYDADARSPLARQGVEAEEGDWLLAVNGYPVDASMDVYAAFAGTAGEPTEITVNASPTMDGNERTVLVEPLRSERGLRYRAWVASKRELVEELSGGRIGYVHVPDTGRNGQNELVRQFMGVYHKPALLVDERWNGGGQIPTRFIELLNRPVTNYWGTRHGADWAWPPIGHRGPKAMLINHSAGSGGDAFPYYFRQSGLGKLIGTRTWGGLVGLSGNPGHIDGSRVYVPTFGFFELDGTWGIEGHGVAPDIEVIDDPQLMVNGEDPQLAAAVRHLLQELEGAPPVAIQRPASPDRSGSGIRVEDQ